MYLCLSTPRVIRTRINPLADDGATTTIIIDLPQSGDEVTREKLIDLPTDQLARRLVDQWNMISPKAVVCPKKVGVSEFEHPPSKERRRRVDSR